MGLPFTVYSRPCARPSLTSTRVARACGWIVKLRRRAPGADRPWTRFRGALFLGDVVVADTVLACAVEVGSVRQTEFLGGADECLTELVVLDLLGDVHRAVTAVEFIVEAFVVLGLGKNGRTWS